MSENNATDSKTANPATFVWQQDNLAQATNGTWHKLESPLQSLCICTDTRKIKQGDIFLAIKGDNFDGHAYLEKAKELGAIASIVSDLQEIDLPQLQVLDTKLALGSLGKFVRNTKTDLKVVALTGSMGKTTTKEMLGSIFSQKAPTLITRGNLNNDLGVPMMLLELSDKHEYAVMELGANHVGEISYTSNMVNPHVACVLNIGTAHLGEFGGRDNICKAKAEIFEGLTNNNTAVVPINDDYSAQLSETASENTTDIISFGRNNTAEVTAKNVTVHALGSEFELVFASHPNKHVQVSLNFAGEHNVTNALAAAACALKLGFTPEEIATGLSNAEAPKGRLNPIAYKNHLLIDDSYNANPDAALAAAEVLVCATKEKSAKETTPVASVLVIGDIGELGDDAEKEHEKLGNALAHKTIDYIFCVGDLMQHCSKSAQSSNATVKHFTDKNTLTSELNALMNAQPMVVLFKGSRFMKMETIIQDLQGKS